MLTSYIRMTIIASTESTQNAPLLVIKEAPSKRRKMTG